MRHKLDSVSINKTTVSLIKNVFLTGKSTKTGILRGFDQCMTVFVDRKFPLCDYTTDYAAGATRYAAFHVTHSAYMCFIRVLRQVAVTGAT